MTADEFADILERELVLYSNEITNGLKKDVDIVSKEVNEEIKKHITFKQHTGKYVKAFRIKKSYYENKFNKKNVWYVAKPQYRLTHLLENGHALAQGGRTKAYPHIKYGEELAKRRMEELAKETIKNAGR